ncbi:MAG: c-type cytochrome [Betaproteobacteria bacterium]|nr:c-type cytochrome [Betaproteobacteria bacterium]
MTTVLLAGCNKPSSVDPEETARLIAPVAQVKLGPAVTVAKGSQTGEQVVTAVCGSCHASGALNAPKIGEASQWGPRIAQGLATLTKHATSGFNQMPARGGNADLTDEEIVRAIAYMANKSGGHFAEPPVPEAK